MPGTPGDRVALAWTAAFFGWLAFDWFGPAWAPLLDFVLFAPLGLAVGVLQLRVAARIGSTRERVAWSLLAAAAFSRFLSGSIWGLWVAVRGMTGSPPWLVSLASGYLVFGVAALLTFPSASWHPVDRLRHRLDGAIVLLGSILVVWFFALGPFLRVRGASSPAFQDYLYTLGDSFTVVLAAVLYLRSGTRLTRTVSSLLLLAFTLQVFPDIAFASGGHRTNYHAGDAIAGIWYAVWAVKWLAARYAIRELDVPGRPALRASAEYRSGVMPYVFLVAANGVLLWQLVTGNRADSGIFLFGSAALAALLVVRQAVELRERGRLYREHLAEAAWYRALFHHAYDFVVLVDADARVTYASPATTRLLGDTVDLGQPQGLFAVVHPDGVAPLRELLAQPAIEPVTIACRVRGGDGAWHDFAFQLHDLRADPLVSSVVIHGHDRTRETRLAERLRESREVEALGIFAGGLAHDLNNILTVIGSHTELLLSDPPADPRAGDDLRAIGSATARASGLTRGLLALSRRKSSAREPVDVGSLLRERLDALRDTREWEVTTLTPPQPVRADRHILSQAIDALLGEAMSARRDGRHPVLSLDARPVDADTAARLDVEAGTYVALRVGCANAVPALRTTSLVPPHRETVPEELSLLMVRAAVREVGGTLTLDDAGDDRCVTLYLPAVAA